MLSEYVSVVSRNINWEHFIEVTGLRNSSYVFDIWFSEQAEKKLLLYTPIKHSNINNMYTFFNVT